jgi:3-hydroxyacyl-CoA dehydrogenase
MDWRGPDRIGKVAVIGAGLIGSGWVAAFLASGRSVAVFDPAADAPDKVRAHVARAVEEMSQLGHAAMPGSLSFHTDLVEAVADADFVQENAPERPDMKAALFADLDRLLPPDVVVASSTSSLPISQLAADCAVGARFVLGHPFNPVHLMPLVELGGGERTDPAAIDTAEALYVSMGKQPIRLQREIFGHIANRLTSAMFREAVSLVASGAATVEDVDKAIRYGPALKWAIQGQFTTFHTSGGEGGLAHFLEHFSPGIMKRWESMETPDLMDPALRTRLAEQIEKAHDGKPVAQIAAHQDAMLLKLLQILGNSDE